MTEKTILARKANIIKDSNARRITLTQELEALGLKEADSVSVSVFEEKGKRWIVLQQE
jgi:hypothetical protein